MDNAIIIGFNVRQPSACLNWLTRRRASPAYSVIYSAIDDIEAALKGMLKPEYESCPRYRRDPRMILPFLEVRQHCRFDHPLGHHQAYSRLAWYAMATWLATTCRSNRYVAKRTMSPRSVKASNVSIDMGSFNDIKDGDIIETFEMREKPRD